VEVVAAVLALHAEPAGLVAAAVQVALHFLAHSHVFRLDLVRDRDAVADVVRVLVRGEVQVEDHAAPVHRERHHDVRVQHSGVDVDHHVGEDPPVRREVARPRAARLPFPSLQRAALQHRVAVGHSPVILIVQHPGQTGVDRVHVVAAVEVVIDVDLPVTREVVVLPGVEHHPVESIP